MELCDISDLPHGERARLYLSSQFGLTGASPELRQSHLDHVRNLATAEMLDEIHTMLRALLLPKPR